MAGRELPKTFSRDEFEALVAQCNLDVPTGLRDRCLIAVMHRCGLRVSEACGLHLRDVDWREAEIHLRAEVAKGGYEATVYIDPPTLALLERWKPVRRRYAAGKPHLFVRVRSGAGQGGPLDRRDVYKMVRRRAAKAGIERKVGPHVFRHTFATDLMREDFHLREIQRACRHRDPRTTAIYAHVYDRELAEKIRGRT